jgi:hypothetical protein
MTNVYAICSVIPAWSIAMKIVLTTMQIVMNMSTNASVIKSSMMWANLCQQGQHSHPNINFQQQALKYSFLVILGVCSSASVPFWLPVQQRALHLPKLHRKTVNNISSHIHDQQITRYELKSRNAHRVGWTTIRIKSVAEYQPQWRKQKWR